MLTWPPNEKKTREVELNRYYNLDNPGRYQVRAWAEIRQAGRISISTGWNEFNIVVGKERFWKDLQIKTHRDRGPYEEDAAVIVYGLPQYQLVYYRRESVAKGMKFIQYKRLEETDLEQKPIFFLDKSGEAHIFISEQPWTEAEIITELKKSPRLQAIRKNNLFYH